MNVVLLLAATVPCDPRTAARVMRGELARIKGRVLRERIEAKARELKIALPSAEQSTPT